ncbi:rsmG [Acrasis kona]|uniref:RsmG n=1 Tax=Acrasis kona TaxID=1008807 RepID=A0AAW2ZEV1_9EUKA
MFVGADVAPGSIGTPSEYDVQILQKTITIQKSTIEMLIEENNNLKNMMANLTAQTNLNKSRVHHVYSASPKYHSILHGVPNEQQSYTEYETYDTYDSYLSDVHSDASGPQTPMDAPSPALDLKLELEKSGIRLNHSRIWVPPTDTRKKKKSKRDSMKQDLSRLCDRVRDALCLSAQRSQ